MTAKTMDDAAGAPEANTQASRFASRPMLPRRPTRSFCAKVLSPALCRTRWQASTEIRIARNRERRVISSGPRAPRAEAVDSAAQPSHEHLLRLLVGEHARTILLGASSQSRTRWSRYHVPYDHARAAPCRDRGTARS
jgi:hypothetical protein